MVRQNRSILYMAQKSLLTDTPENLIKKYTKVLQDNGLEPEAIIIFGSYANNTADESSDLDLCIVSPAFGKDSFEEMVMLARLAQKVDPLIEPHPYNPRDLANKWDPLATEIRTKGRQIL